MGDGYSWPDEHVHWQGVIPAANEWSIPFATHVFIFHTREQLRAACQNDRAEAHSSTFNEPDDNGVGAMLFFSLDEIHFSLAAHEATHVALVHHSQIEDTRIGAKRWLYDHPESVAEMVGNLTALVWAALFEHGIGDDE